MTADPKREGRTAQGDANYQKPETRGNLLTEKSVVRNRVGNTWLNTRTPGFKKESVPWGGTGVMGGKYKAGP